MTRQRIRCALYTRKSSEEGLDQSFNSLDAQREACDAYVRSQSGEGWTTLPSRYDDGGYSGGTMERPALQRLLSDIASGRIDVVVVYKIDRLTRSLPDFARMVELFDRHAVSFVSVTQAFNTTNSMGRLTLNVLLSFAQFEREVTGERIRDKIAASKAKGMWMGGMVPLGYDLPRDGSRALAVNPGEAETVRTIFRTYLELGSVHALERWLGEHGYTTKRVALRDGRIRGGQPFRRGALFHLLRNPVYVGKITHKDKVHDGLHDPILDQALFDAVQDGLAGKVRRGKAKRDPISSQMPLTGLIFDATGERMSPTFAVGRHGKRYRYYVSTSLQKGQRAPEDGLIRRVPALLLEQTIHDRLNKIDGLHSADPFTCLMRIEVHKHRIVLTLPANLRPAVFATLAAAEHVEAHPTDPRALCLSLPFDLPDRSAAAIIRTARRPGPTPDPVLIRALRRAHAMVQTDRTGLPWLEASPTSPHQRRLVRLAFLAPELQAAILSGRQPEDLSLSKLLGAEFPISWAEQMTRFGQVET
ncbi:recombinase family protein [Marimonas sp. MJW-29]|uniref:Recombinase family protein n=1 Tax=Sulfitobacter sediminis TaxID=3234186 RepID=A0ABV3RRM5_9RHOB